ncbi:MAG: prepilin-type N-terminal cleavage/methylation domain-containing protein [Holosporales bacterium]|jgi:prepilin-type N-terminal cleavage/methylation domain-containing protein|nr:prepilin-type N-terminal cleavage/methylation domain-containing protein [Holosporales bacterium]
MCERDVRRLAGTRYLSQKELPGFSLVEISIVLLIIGILAGAVMKGKDLIESAQLQSVASDIHDLQISYASYVSSYGSIPGNDGAAIARFGGGVKNGSGSGALTSEEAKEVMKHLHAAGLINSENFKLPKIGGTYDVIAENGVAKVRLSDDGKEFLSYKQVVALRAKISDLTGSLPDDIEITPSELKPDGKYLLKVKIR